MKGKRKFFLALLCSTLIAGTPFGSMAADKIPTPPSNLGITSDTVSPPPSVTPPGNDGLLSGMTPQNHKIPSGWSLVRATDFEGTQPAGENWTLWSSSVSTEKPHTGSKSLGGTYSRDQSFVGWSLSGSSVGTFTELYISFYEWIDSNALFNDEFFLARFYKSSPVFQEIIMDWYWAPGFNKPNATLYVVPQGNRTARLAAKSATVPKGAWVQWEIHYRPNTSGAANGFMRIYKDGTLFTSAENVNLNGTVSMSSNTVEIGGVYTKLVWMTDYPTCSLPSGCSSAPGKGTDYCVASMKWSGQSFSNPKCNPIDPPLASFKRYFDDIILLKK